MTDPVIHYHNKNFGRRKPHNGRTDKGKEGIEKFFQTHRCNALCRRLGLKKPPPTNLKMELLGAIRNEWERGNDRPLHKERLRDILQDELGGGDFT
eukprot:2909725-Rhodomonas_salina.3